MHARSSPFRVSRTGESRAIWDNSVIRTRYTHVLNDDGSMSVCLLTVAENTSNQWLFRNNNRIQFTCKIGNTKINFLDTTIIVENNIIKFDLYYKPTFFEEIFNYHSQHPLSHKKGPIFEMVNKVILISYPDFHKRNFDLIIKILLDNDYPLKFIFDTVRLRIKTLRNII